MIAPSFRRCVRAAAVAFTLLVAAGSAYALPDRSGWPHEGSDLPLHPALITGRLENGIRYVLLEHQTPKDRVSMHLNVQAGSLHETEAQRGLAHFLEHMAFNGSKNFPPGTLIEYFQEIGMNFGGDTNAHTGLDETVYDLRLPTGDRESLKRGLTVLADYAGGLLLPVAEIEKEKGVILAEKRARDSVSYRTGVALRQFLYPGLRMNDREPIGLASVIKKGDRKEFKDFYDTWYRPERMVVVMVGDFNAKEAKPLIRDLFSGIQDRAPERPEPTLGKLNHKGVKFFHYAEPESAQVTVTISTATSVSPEKDTIAYQKQTLTRFIGSAILRNRLADRLSDPDTPFLRGFATNGRSYGEIDTSRMIAISEPENWEKSLIGIETALRQALKHGFTTAELDRVRKGLLTRIERNITEFPDTESDGLAAQIISCINGREVFLSPEDEKRILKTYVEHLTPEMVHAAFRDVWKADHRLITLTGNTGLTDADAIPALKAAWETSAKKAVAAPIRETSVTFPYLPAPETENAPVTRKKTSDLDFETVTFANGTILHIKRTDFEADTVQMVTSFGYGRSMEPKAYPGLSSVAGSLVNLSGLGKLERKDLSRALAGKTASARFSIGEDSFRISGAAKTGEFPLLLELIRHRLLDPAFREDSWRLARKWARQQDRQIRTSVDAAMKYYGPGFFACGDSRTTVPSATEMTAELKQAAENWLRPILANAPLSISVVGDVDPETVIRLVGRYFGGLERNGKTPKEIRPMTFCMGAKATYWVPTEIPSARIRIAFPTDDIHPIAQSRGLSLLAKVLGDRLRKEIRENRGLAYSPGSYHRASEVYEDFGGLYIMTGAKPEQADTVRTAVMDVVRTLRKEGVSEEELKRVRDPLMNNLKERFEKNRFWLFAVLDGSDKNPDQLDRIRTVESGYLAVTPEELTQLARKWLVPANAASITVLPAKGETL